MIQDEHTDERRPISFHRKPSFHDNMMLAYKKQLKVTAQINKKLFQKIVIFASHYVKEDNFSKGHIT